MHKAEKMVIAALIGSSAVAWIASMQQPDMMTAMITYNPIAISLFTASWTAGMAAMMFPAITPMVLLYNRLVTNKQESKGGQSSIMFQPKQRPGLLSLRSFRVTLFIGSYLLVWALTGIGLLLGWSVLMNNTIMMAFSANSSHQLLIPSIYGALLIIAGAYQFTPLKRICIGYCESPLSFFMRRWRDGTFGAMRMGLWHGMYCLGCCWAYFLLMVALGWMNLLWMGLFAGIIFGEKIWSRGIWIARAAGVGLAITGILVILGILPSLIPSTALSISDNNNHSSSNMNMNDTRKMDDGNAHTPIKNMNSNKSSISM
jgi:predicted metal-binding membrane protein